MRRTLELADENHIPFLASALTFDTLLAAVPFVLLVLAGLGQLLEGTASVPPSPTELFERFLLPNLQGPDDPFAAAEATLGRFASFGQTVTLAILPTQSPGNLRPYSQKPSPLAVNRLIQPSPARFFLRCKYASVSL